MHPRSAHPEPGLVLRRGSCIAARYQLERELAGRRLWVAIDHRLDRRVALKMCAAHEDPACFEQDARTLAQLSEPHVVRVHDVGHHRGVPYYVMELLEGDDLAAVLQRAGCTDRALAEAIVERMADGLDAAVPSLARWRGVRADKVFLTVETGAPCIKLLGFSQRDVRAARPRTTPRHEEVS